MTTAHRSPTPSFQPGVLVLALLGSVLGLTTGTAQAAVEVLVPAGSSWRYVDDGNQRPNWQAVDFDDSSWAAGGAQLGYGDGDETTVVSHGTSSQDKHMVTWFRTSFDLDDPDNIIALELRLLRDDGAAVYLNGTEIRRSNLPSGTLTATTPAAGTVGGHAETQFETTVLGSEALGLLRSGKNVIAVSIHQVVRTSSDISFDLELRATVLQTQPPTGDTTVTVIGRGASWRYLDDGIERLNWQAPSFDDSGWASGPAQLGYGDGDEATVVSFGNSQNKHVVTWLRHSFSVADSADVVAIELELLRDDAAAIYLNGTEIARSNLPGGTLTSGTKAASTVAGSAEREFNRAALVAGAHDLLTDGQNVLAVSVHQASTLSSDLSFDLSLDLVYDADPPEPPTTPTGDVTWIPQGATWRYWDRGTLPVGFASPSFDDSSWESGPAQLGYGDGDEATRIDFGSALNRHITTWFRRAFTVEAANAVTDLSLRLLRDDGAAVYLNGTEILRSNLPSGELGDSTKAPLTIAGSDERAFTQQGLTASVKSLLVEGRNVLAVSLHQASTLSSDLSFDLELVGTYDGTTPPVSPSPAAEVTLIPKDSVWHYWDRGSEPGGFASPSFDDSSWPAGPGPLGYGDGDESTVISFGPDPGNKFVTAWFRKQFQVSDAASFERLDLRPIIDDGAVFYLNGQEVFRLHMPDGAIHPQTRATNTVGGVGEGHRHNLSLDPALIVDGENTLAVEVHQASSASSDMSFDAELLASTSRTRVTRGPYLQMLGEDSVVVRWRTDRPAESRVFVGPPGEDFDRAVVDSSNTTEHAVLVDGLSPSTAFAYGVGTGGEVLKGGPDHTFETAPVRGASDPMRVWVLGDSGAPNERAIPVRNAFRNFAASEPPDLVLMLGDNAYGLGKDEEYQASVFDMYTDELAHIPFWPTFGNHDADSASSGTESGPYYDIFSLPRQAELGGVASGTEAYYSFDRGNVHFVVLDSQDSDRSANGAMMSWLEDDLSATSAQWIVAFWHHPPYGGGSHHPDFDERLVEMRANALPILEDHAVDLVLTGHNHAYERSRLLDGHYGPSGSLLQSMILDSGDGRPGGDGAYRKRTNPTPHDGAVYVVAGSSSRVQAGALRSSPLMVVQELVHGSAVLDFAGNRLDVTFVTDTGSVLDNFTIRKVN